MKKRLQAILADNDRQGERQIALFQALMAMIALFFHLYESASAEHGAFSGPAAIIAGTILVSSLLRIRFSRKINQHNFKLHLLTVTDGALIFALVISSSIANNLPLETTFTTPTLIFLVVFVGIRVLRFDPVTVAVAGLTVLCGWCVLVLAVAASSPQAALSGAVQMGMGFAAMLVALMVAMSRAREILGSAAHVSELEEANRKAEEHVAQHEELLRSSIDAIVITDDTGVIERANPAMAALFGYGEIELVGKSAAMLMSPADAESLANGVRNYLLTGTSAIIGCTFESEGRDREGRPVAIDLSISSFVSGGKQRFAGFMRDARARKEDQSQLMAAKERAEFANRAKASFLAMMSHEVRTPLHGLLGILEMLSTAGDERDRAELIKVAQGSGSALLQIINDILDFSKLDEGKLSIVPEPFELARLIDGVVSLVQPLAAEKYLALKAEMDGPLPQLLLGDQGRIRQILLNPATNAVKFTDKGTVAISVTDHGSPDAPRIRFVVRDSGRGIDPSRHHLVFREFETLGAQDDARQSGTGLGLAICRRLVAAMGGEIGFHSIEHQGSTFWFELPLKAMAERRSLEHRPESVVSPGQLAGLRVLAVEDNLTNQFLIRRNLELVGVQVDIAGDGEKALSAIRAQQYDAVLMDVSMPGMDGITATLAIRQMEGRSRNLPVIMMSAYAFPEDRSRAMAAGASEYLTKPVSRADLVRAISACVGLAGGTVEAPLEPGVFDGIIESFSGAERDLFIDRVQADIAANASMALAAARNNDLEAMERATHALKGVAGAVGASAVERLATQLNDAVREGPGSISNEVVAGLQARSAELLLAVAAQYGKGNMEAARAQ